MLFSWLRRRRRRKLLAEPFPVRWAGFLDRNVGHYPRLSAAEQARLRDVARVLIDEKRWLGRGGLFITEEMRVTIAAQAALLLLGADHGYFRRVKDIVVFPTTFRTPVAMDDWEDDELSDRILAGQAVDRGPVLLAWDQVLPEGRNPDAGLNVVIHEFAHQLDFADELTLSDQALESRWRYVMSVAFEDYRRAARGNPAGGFFTHHAAENEMEFFAEAAEAFYCRPGELKAEFAAVYDLFSTYFGADPIRWHSNRR